MNAPRHTRPPSRPTLPVRLVLLLVGLVLLHGCAAQQPRAPQRARRRAAPVPWSLQDTAPAAPAWMDQAPAIASPTPPSLATARKLQLTPQIPLYLLNRPGLPLVHVALVVRAGAADGLHPAAACTAADLLDEGAGRRNALALSAAVEQIGADLTTQCGWSWTSVAISSLKQHLGQSVKLLLDVVTRPKLTKRDFARVREKLRGRALARRADPVQVADLVLRQSIFGPHPYGRSLLPLPQHLDALRHRDVVGFYRRHYRPARVFAVAVGDIDSTTARKLLLSRLATWTPPSPGRIAQAPQTTPPRTGPRLVIVDRPGATQSVLRVGLLGAQRKDPGHPALLLLNTALGGSFTSRINQNLRETRGLTYGAQSQVWSSRSHGLFSMGAAVETPGTITAIEQMLIEMRGLAARPPQGSELTRARSSFVERLPERTETLAGLATIITELVALDLPLDHPNQLIAQLARQSSSALGRTARRTLDPTKATLVVVGDAANLAKPLVARFGPATYRDPDGMPLP